MGFPRYYRPSKPNDRMDQPPAEEEAAAAAPATTTTTNPGCGCEGPNSKYVKLISADGHEFILKRKHVVSSLTLEACNS